MTKYRGERKRRSPKPSPELSDTEAVTAPAFERVPSVEEAQAESDRLRGKVVALRTEMGALRTERDTLEAGRADLVFEAADDPAATAGLEELRQRLEVIDHRLAELADGERIGEERLRAQADVVTRIRRLILIERAMALGPEIDRLGDELDAALAMAGQAYGRLRLALGHGVSAVAGTFPNVQRAHEFMSFQDDAGRLDSAAKLFLECHGGPHTDDDLAIPNFAPGRAQAPAPSDIVRGRTGHWMALLDDLAAQARARLSRTPSAAEAADPGVVDDVEDSQTETSPDEPIGLAERVADLAMAERTAAGLNVVQLVPPVPVSALDSAEEQQPIDVEAAAAAARADALAASLDTPMAPLSPADLAELQRATGGRR